MKGRRCRGRWCIKIKEQGENLNSIQEIEN